MSQVSLLLFIAGQTPESWSAIADVVYLCEYRLTQQCRLTIIDIVEQPEIGADYGILVTPTLMRIDISPRRQVVGTFDATPQVLQRLELSSDRH
ncbi:MAG: circadian clock KaiB family protein [Thainema sp.]